MNYWAIFESIAGLLAVSGVAKGVTLLLASLTAERDWRRAIKQLPQEQLGIFADILAEQRMLTETELTLRRKYAASVLRDLVAEMQTSAQLPERSARVIESALSQPSAVGRQAYADKLTREALHERNVAGVI